MAFGSFLSSSLIKLKKKLSKFWLKLSGSVHAHETVLWDKRLNTLNDSSGSSRVRTDAQTLRCKLFFARFCIMLYEPSQLIAHAASGGSDEPAHLHSLARDIAAHIHNESACLKFGL